jgi:hypothetical protein
MPHSYAAGRMYQLFEEYWVRISAGTPDILRHFLLFYGWLHTASRPALRPTPPPIQWVSGALSLGVKRPGREADHSLVPRSKNAWSYTSTPPLRLHGMVLG